MTHSLQTLLETALTLTQQRSQLQRDIDTLRETLAQTDALLEKTLQEALKTPRHGTQYPSQSKNPETSPSKPNKTPADEETLKAPKTLQTLQPPRTTKLPEKKPSAVLKQKGPEPSQTPPGLRDTKKQDMARQIETLLLENPDGLRVDQIAEKTGRSQSNVYVWLTGRAHEYITHLKKVGPGTWAIVK